MSEEPGKYITQDTLDALEMMGKGYSEPATVIEPPHKTLRRKKGEDFEEHESPAWIKFSTAFKDELPEIGGNALKVWIYIALSVNYHGEAFPGIMTIAKGIGLSHPTVLECIRELESLKILTVRRGEKRHNIYNISDDYVAIGRGQSVKKVAWSDDDHESDHETFSPNHETRVESNKRKLEDNKKHRTSLPEGSDMAFQMAAGMTSEQLSQHNERVSRQREVAATWERLMGYGALEWWSDRKLEKLLAFLMDKTPEEMGKFADWCNRKYSTFDTVKARLHPELVREFWPQAFARAAEEIYEEM